MRLALSYHLRDNGFGGPSQGKPRWHRVRERHQQRLEGEVLQADPHRIGLFGARRVVVPVVNGNHLGG